MALIPQERAQILKIMYSEAEKKDPPVFRAEKETMHHPFKALVFVALSARTKDDQTLRAVNRLFNVADTPEKIVALEQNALEQLIYGTGFYKNKAKNLRRMCQQLIETFEGKVPDTREELISLQGVGRKTANIVLARVHGQFTLGVDTHVHRISNRLGWVRTKKPEETETKLMKLVPLEEIPLLNKTLVAYGQTICASVSPWCSTCKVREYCKRVGVKKSR